MKITELITLVEKQKNFSDWKQKNPDGQLVHVFVLFEPGQKKKYDIGYYNTKTKKMASFTVLEGTDDTESREEDEILKDPDYQIMPLTKEDICIELDKALGNAIKLQKEKYKKDEALKYILILQKLKIGQVWNITFVTKQFNTLNIKIDSKTGKTVEDSLHSLFQFSSGKK
jgi:hypothetical protein